MIEKTDKYINEIKEISDNKSIFDRNSPFENTLVYLDKGNVLGFLIYDVIYEKVEIIYIFVRKECRNMHIGYKLLNNLINSLKDMENITLEVRCNNPSAIHLYEKMGFKKVATREKYYCGIDGILMEKKL